MENKNIMGVYRILYLMKDSGESDGLVPKVTYLCCEPSSRSKIFAPFVNDPRVVRASCELMLYFDCEDIGKIEWFKNDLIDKKEGE